jgi:hypothetical protein
MTVLNIDLFQCPCIKKHCYRLVTAGWTSWNYISSVKGIPSLCTTRYGTDKQWMFFVMSKFLYQKCSNSAELPFKVSWGNGIFEQQTQKNLQGTIFALRWLTWDHWNWAVHEVAVLYWCIIWITFNTIWNNVYVLIILWVFYHILKTALSEPSGAIYELWFRLC